VRGGRGTVHRLWEPLADKQRRQRLRAKFSTPTVWRPASCTGTSGSTLHGCGVKDKAVLDVAAKVRYVVDPRSLSGHYTGHIRAVMNDDSVVEERQPYMRGGAMSRSPPDIEDKFALCARHGGWEAARIQAALKLARGFMTERWSSRRCGLKSSGVLHCHFVPGSTLQPAALRWRRLDRHGRAQ